MTGWIIYHEALKNKENAFEWMIEEGKKFNLNIEIKFLEKFNIIAHDDISVFYEGAIVQVPDFVLMRCYDIDLGQALQYCGSRVFNKPSAMELSMDKWKTHAILSKNKIPTPKTLKVRRSDVIFGYIKEMIGVPFVMKTPIGSKGEGIYLIYNQQDIDSLLEKEKSEFFICQEYIEESSGEDIRVHVIGDRVVAAIKRSSNGDFRSNFSLGGNAEKISISKGMEELAIEGTKALGLEIAGVDILLGKNGELICEINGNAGFITVWKCTDVSIPNEIMKYISNSMKTKKKGDGINC
ncbi:RimK family alpha-L-glutamate ligase [Oceanirhabdus seepicola]|uniref:RimK family alpha-L-glutamate ligase n=1 Tax=Oceanirhabdus seepicola TaxID=2828781 RepID=A0A9J6P2D0_9CLOT|nr:RimK family alpha-L-glutamate ligase [Oceanirhabdus seepicola]MCM1990767.1 RimK family alpha-L-glutamate ligase [Oceanirhabdus seepicola]